MTSMRWSILFAAVWIACGMEKIEPSEEKCVICFDSVDDHESHERSIVKLQNCIHKFHSDCIRTWLDKNTSCPVCRREIKELFVNALKAFMSLRDFRQKFQSINSSSDLQNSQGRQLALQHSQNNEPSQTVLQCLLPWMVGLIVVMVIIAYYAIVGTLFHGDVYKLLHASIFPWVYPITVFVYVTDEYRRNNLHFRGQYALTVFTWILVEMGIIIARIYVPGWHIWFDFMQELQVLGLLWIPVLRSSTALNFIGLAGLISYHSVMPLLFSGMQLFHSIFWPWFSTIFICISCLFVNSKREPSPLSNNI